MDTDRRATGPPPAGCRVGAGSPSWSEPEDHAVDVDGLGIGPGRPREVRKRVLSRAVQHGAVQMEARAVAGAVEARLRVISAGLHEGDRATQVGAVDGEDVYLSRLVLDDVPTEGELAGRIVSAAVRHNESRVRAGRGVELDRVAGRQLVDRGGKRHLDHRLLLVPLI